MGGGLPSHANGLVGMRVIATFLIAIYHWELYYPFIRGKQIFSSAFLCVEFFFVMSGFLFAKSMIQKNNNQKFSDVVTSKFIRLWPAFIVGTLLLPCVYATAFFGGNFLGWLKDGNHMRSFLIELPMLQSSGIGRLEYVNGPAWYASALLICSAILYFLLKYARRIYGVLALFFSILFFLSFFANTPADFVFNVIPFPLIRGMAEMSLGIFIYYLHTILKAKICSLSNFIQSTIEIFAIIFFLTMLILQKSTNYNLMVLSTFIILIPISIIVLFMFSENTGIVSKLLKNEKWGYLAEISYSFFIMQSFCSNVFTCLYPNIQKQPYVTFLYLTFNLVVAIGVHEFVEKPLTNFLLCIKNTTFKKGNKKWQ